jgi:hypothetical protein
VETCQWRGKTFDGQHLPYVCPNAAVYRLDWPDDVDWQPTFTCRTHMPTFIERMVSWPEVWVTVSEVMPQGVGVKPALTVHEGGRTGG